MFGYIMVNKPELKIREFDMYHEYYCGLCRRLKACHGIVSQFSLSFDHVFLIMLLTGLYEPQETREKTRCAIHPLKEQNVRYNEFTDYLADMTVVFARLKCMDDWNDEKKFSRKAYGSLLKKQYEKVRDKYPEKVEIIEQGILNVAKAEQEQEKNIDVISGYFARLFSEIFAVYNDEWEYSLRRIGFYLGKYIYIMDAYDDLEKDIRENLYNPFKEKYHEENFEEYIRQILMVNAAECAREFEKLPIVSGQVSVLRNILYSGIWSKFTAVSDRRKKDDKSL